MDCVSPNFDFGDHGDLNKQVHLFDGVLQQYREVIPILPRSVEALCEQWVQSPPPQSSSSDFQALRQAAIKINKVLRTLVLSTSNCDIDRRKLRAIYGEKLYKCIRPDCMMFLTGFEDERTLRRHESAHEWDVMCHVGEFPRSRFGFRSQAQCESHIASAHPKFSPKDVDIETTPAVSCTQSYTTSPKERMEILCEAILSGDVELAAEFLDLDLSLHGHLKGKDLLDRAVQSESIKMTKFITSKFELKKSFLKEAEPVLKFSTDDVVNAFLWAVRLDCRDIITFFLESQFVPDLATRMIAIDQKVLDLELYKLVGTIWSKMNMNWLNPNCINALAASLIINGNNQFKFIIGHNIDIDGPIYWNPWSYYEVSTTSHVLLCWNSSNYAKLWLIVCQLFENGADVNLYLPGVKKTIFIEALHMKWHDRKEVDAVKDLIGFGANLHEETRNTKWTVLNFLIRSSHPRVFSLIKYLVEERGLDIQKQEANKCTLFFATVRSANPEIIDIMKYLENRGLDLHAKCIRGRNVAFSAISSINLATKLEVVKYLRDQHVDFTLRLSVKGNATATLLEFYKDYLPPYKRGNRIPEVEIEVTLECLAAGAEPWWESVSGDHAGDLRNLKAPTWNMLKSKKPVAPDDKA
ncbi:hypothetical protein BDD12DRAFT_873150 [Trichophaea hybrida]|nr:hypothetical protein BDD12DRAFT_873150 [Trichophaea hybrida]